MKKECSVLGFVLKNLYGYILPWFIYKNLCFSVIDGMTYADSLKVLFACLGGSFLVGLLTQIRSRRTTLSVIVNVLTGYGAYAAIAYLPVMRSHVVMVLLFTAASIAVYTILLLLTWRRKGSASRGIRSFIKGSQVLAAAGMLVLMAVPCLNFTVLSGFMGPRDVAASVSSEDTIANHMDTLEILYSDQWYDLSSEEKLNVLQTAANIERRYLGIPHELNVVVRDLDREGLAGYYSDRDHTIALNSHCLLHDPPYEMLNTICHESYHAYQHSLVRMYESSEDQFRGLKINRQIRKYEAEFKDYIGVEGDFDSYYDQACEQDARAYAKDAVDDYYYKIREHLQNNS